MTYSTDPPAPRVTLLIECLRHYAQDFATYPRSQVIEKTRQYLEEIAQTNPAVEVDLDEILSPLENQTSLGYYEVSYLLFRAMAENNNEIDELDAEIRAAGLPRVGEWPS